MLHRLAHRDDREAGLLGHPLGGAVAGAGLGGLDRGVGHAAGWRRAGCGCRRGRGRSRRPSSPARAAGWRRTRRRAGSRRWHMRVDDPVVAEHDQRAGAAAQDPLEAVAQLGAGRDRGQGRAQQIVVAAVHGNRCSFRAKLACGADDRLRRTACAQSSRWASERPMTRPGVRRRGGAHTGWVISRTAERMSATSTTCMPSGVGPPPRDPPGTTACAEAEPGGLGEPAGDAGDRADLAGQAHLADRDGAAGQRPVGDGAGHGQGHRQVGGRLGQAHPADGRDVGVAPAAPARRRGGRGRRGSSRPGSASRPLVVRRGRGDDARRQQRLHLGDQGPAALEGDRDAGARDR